MAKQKAAPAVSVGQIWCRPDGSRLVVTRLRHEEIPGSHRLREGLAEIRAIGDGPDGWISGQPNRVLVQNMPKYYTYEGMRWPQRLDVLERISPSGDGNLFLLIGMVWQWNKIQKIWLTMYSPRGRVKSLELGKYNAKRFWGEYRIIGYFSEQEYQQMDSAASRRRREERRLAMCRQQR